MQIEGTAPLVVLGPNGSGKTQLASRLASSNSAEFINALRNIQLNDQLTSQSLEQSKNELQSRINDRRSSYWQLADEIQVLFGKLLAEDAESAIRFRDTIAAGTEARPEETVLTRVRGLWAEVFPGRTISLADGAPKVTSEYTPNGAATYAASRMSDGERVALYLAGRVLNVSATIVVIDEPEVHFHSRLAVRFWDALERARPDLRFVYVTHDLAFALSRIHARYLLVRPNRRIEILELDAELPVDIARSILGAASFSVYAERILFCEGTESGPDFRILSAWIRDRRTTVIPVGSCADVLRCCSVFNESSLVSGLTAEGVIDRDYWPDAFLTSLPSTVVALPVHEIESLYCIPALLRMVAAHLGRDCEDVLSSFEAQSRSLCSQTGYLHKQALERTKARVEPHITGLLARARANDDVDLLKDELAALTDKGRWPLDPVAVFEEELNRLSEVASSGTIDELVVLFPGKPLLTFATKALGLSGGGLTELIQSALRAKEGALHDLGETLATVLESALPLRVVAPVNSQEDR